MIPGSRAYRTRKAQVADSSRIRRFQKPHSYQGFHDQSTPLGPLGHSTPNLSPLVRDMPEVWMDASASWKSRGPTTNSGKVRRQGRSLERVTRYPGQGLGGLESLVGSLEPGVIPLTVARPQFHSSSAKFLKSSNTAITVSFVFLMFILIARYVWPIPLLTRIHPLVGIVSVIASILFYVVARVDLKMWERGWVLWGRSSRTRAR